MSDDKGPRANLKTPWIAPFEDKPMPGIPAVELRALGDEQRRLLDICEAFKADPAKWVRENDAQIAALKALLKEARIILRPFAEAAGSYGPNDDPHGGAWAHDFMIGSLRGANTLVARIKKELGNGD